MSDVYSAAAAAPPFTPVMQGSEDCGDRHKAWDYVMVPTWALTRTTFNFDVERADDGSDATCRVCGCNAVDQWRRWQLQGWWEHAEAWPRGDERLRGTPCRGQDGTPGHCHARGVGCPPPMVTVPICAPCADQFCRVDCGRRVVLLGCTFVFDVLYTVDVD